jgi:hypothetical protein
MFRCHLGGRLGVAGSSVVRWATARSREDNERGFARENEAHLVDFVAEFQRKIGKCLWCFLLHSGLLSVCHDAIRESFVCTLLLLSLDVRCVFAPVGKRSCARLKSLSRSGGECVVWLVKGRRA